MNFELDKTKGKLQEILEDSEDEYPVPFADPSDLIDIFSMLEEQNLFLIQQGQDNEQQIEQKKDEYKQIEKNMEKELNGLTESKQQVVERMGKTQAEKTVLS